MRYTLNKFLFLILAVWIVAPFIETGVHIYGKASEAEPNDNNFEKWSAFWMNNAGEELYDPEVLENGITPTKKRISKQVFRFLEPIFNEYEQIVTCNSSNIGIVPEVSEAMCVNRLLEEKSLTELPSDLSQNIKKLLKETFYLGVFTQLYLMDFPTREHSKNVNLSLLRRKWQIDAIAADAEMGYYGNPDNPILISLWEYHYNSKVVPVFRENFHPSAFKFGKYKSFFRNLYLSGALIIMYYDLSTKGALDYNLDE